NHTHRPFLSPTAQFPSPTRPPERLPLSQQLPHRTLRRPGRHRQRTATPANRPPSGRTHQRPLLACWLRRHPANDQSFLDTTRGSPRRSPSFHNTCHHHPRHCRLLRPSPPLLAPAQTNSHSHCTSTRPLGRPTACPAPPATTPTTERLPFGLRVLQIGS